jgi:hypothetical protein
LDGDCGISKAVTPSDLDQFAAYYLERLEDDEDAWFALVKAPFAIMPLLAAAFRSETDAGKRATILNVICQRRDPSTIPLLGEALHDSSPLVWRQAIDGLVATSGPESISTIEAARSRKFSRDSLQREFHEFLDEALQQLR